MDPRREKLLKAKLGAWRTWTKPEIVETIGPYDPSAFDDYALLHQRVIASCADAVLQFSDDEIELLSERPEDLNVTRFQWSAVMSEEIQRLNRFPPPPWYAGGFGHPDHAADFDYWCKMASLRVHEILCLSVGVEPGSIDEKMLAKFAILSKEELDRKWPAIQFLVRRREQLVRQFPPGPHDRRVSPRLFLEWADRLAFEGHPEFLRLLRAHHAEGAQPVPAQAPPKRQDKREVETIAQLFTAMAIKRYRYDPRLDRSEVPGKIARLAASMGLSVSDDTVRKYLKIGASFIPDDWEPE